MRISFCVTTFNRSELTLKSFEQIKDDERVDDIVILDDCSTDGSYEKLREVIDPMSKIRLIRQVQNRGMSLNKRDCIALAKNPWCLIADSDNVFTPAYLDALESVSDLFEYTDEFYLPSWAQPNFDYRAFQGVALSKENIKEYLDKPMMEQALNTRNMVVNRDKYLEVYQHNPEVKETDTLWMNYLWLKAGGGSYIVPNMFYAHLMHPGSGWLSNATYNIDKGAEIKKLIREL